MSSLTVDAVVVVAGTAAAELAGCFPPNSEVGAVAIAPGVVLAKPTIKAVVAGEKVLGSRRL